MPRRHIAVSEIIAALRAWHAGESIRSVSQRLGLARGTTSKFVRAARGMGLQRDVPLPPIRPVARAIKRGATTTSLPPAARGPAKEKIEVHADWVREQALRGEATAKDIWRRLKDVRGCNVSYSCVRRYLRDYVNPDTRLDGLDLASATRIYDTLVRLLPAEAIYRIARFLKRSQGAVVKPPTLFVFQGVGKVEEPLRSQSDLADRFLTMVAAKRIVPKDCEHGTSVRRNSRRTRRVPHWGQVGRVCKVRCGKPGRGWNRRI